MQRLPEAIREFARTFFDAGHELFVVGGAVRDIVRGAGVDDFDFATSALPEEVIALFRRVIPTGLTHGTVTVRFRGQSYEVTTYRTDGTYSDHRRPDAVTFTRSLDEDLSRRDFTVNAMAMHPLTGAIVDPFDGRSDLAKRCIRTVGDASTRFGEDALRMVRAVRFAATLEAQIDTPTHEAMTAHANEITSIAAERIWQELEKLMRARRPSVGWRGLRDTGLLTHIIPELLESADRRFAGTPVDGLFDHLVTACDCAPSHPVELRWAALLHDIAKPRSYATDERGVHFHGHDETGAAMTVEILRRLRAPGGRIDAVAHLVRHHMFAATDAMSDRAIRRLVDRVGRGVVPTLFALRRADVCGKTGRPPVRSALDYVEERIAALEAERALPSRRELAVSGRDIMNHLALSPGPTVGIVLDELWQTVLDDPATNERERLLTIAERLYQERIAGPSAT